MTVWISFFFHPLTHTDRKNLITQIIIKSESVWLQIDLGHCLHFISSALLILLSKSFCGNNNNFWDQRSNFSSDLTKFYDILLQFRPYNLDRAYYISIEFRNLRYYATFSPHIWFITTLNCSLVYNRRILSVGSFRWAFYRTTAQVKVIFHLVDQYLSLPALISLSFVQRKDEMYYFEILWGVTTPIFF